MIYDHLTDFYAPNNFLVYYLSEFSNLFFCILIVLVAKFFSKLSLSEAIYWLIVFLAAFVVNIIINSNFMLFPDTGGYLRCMLDIRDNFQFDEPGCQMLQTSSDDGSLSFPTFKKGFTAILYSLVPMPSIATFSALGMINKVYLFVMYLFLKTQIKSKENIFLLCCILVMPSLFLYSSLGLRDSIIFCIHLILLFLIIKDKFFFSTLVLLILAAVKVQNAVVFSFLYFGHFFFKGYKSNRNLAIYLVVFFMAMIIFQSQIMGTINFFKLAFLAETNNLVELANYVPISLSSLIVNLPVFIFDGFARPFPTSPIYLFFFLESLLQVAFFIYLIKKVSLSKLLRNQEVILVFITIIMGVIVNTIVIDNDFTYLRYKFPFTSLLLIYILFILDKNSGNKKDFNA